MPAEIKSVVIDANDVTALAAFWCDVLGHRVVNEADGEIRIARGPDEPGLLFVPVPEGQDHQEPPAPGDVTWVVLADPEGNEFCVLEPEHQHLQRVHPR